MRGKLDTKACQLEDSAAQEVRFISFIKSLNLDSDALYKGEDE